MSFAAAFYIVTIVQILQANAQFFPSDDNRCTTPDGQSGECINIRTCPSLLSLLTTRPITQEATLFLRSSTCGYEGRNPKVCCALSAPVVTTPTPVTSRPSPGGGGGGGGGSTLDPFIAHRNRRLFPAEDQCGLADFTDRIVGGKNAVVGQYPWMALLGYTDSRGQFSFRCGGSVISDRYILTAAHCIRTAATLSKVRVGEHTISTSPDCHVGTNFCAPPHQDFDVEETSVHSGYNNPTFRHDIGLVRLKEPIRFSSHIRPLCLPFGDVSTRNLEGSRSGEQYIVAGWGRTENASGSDILQYVNLQPFAFQNCADIYRRQVTLADGQFCMGGGRDKKDSCSGDSGGPLMLLTSSGITPKYYQVGLVSIGPNNCGTAGRPGIYTKISPYLRYILDNVRP